MFWAICCKRLAWVNRVSWLVVLVILQAGCAREFLVQCECPEATFSCRVGQDMAPIDGELLELLQGQ